MRRFHDRRRQGAALIEAMLSLILLGTVGTSLLMLLGQTRETLRSAKASEAAMDSSSMALDRLVLCGRQGLTERVGWTTEVGLAVHIEQTSPFLFDVAVSRAAGAPPLLATTVYRADDGDDR